MSGFSSVTPNGYQAVSNYPGMGFGGMGTGFGLDALLILLLLGGNGGMWGGRGNWGGPAANAVASDVVLQPAFQSLQNQITNLSGQFNNTQLQESVGNVATQIGMSTQAITQNQDNNTRDTTAGLTAISNTLENTRFTTLTSINDLGRDVLNAGYQANLQNLNSFNILGTAFGTGLNNLNTNILQGFNQNYLATLTGFNGVKDGLCEISKEIAACCCASQKAIQESTQAILNQMSNDKYAELLEKYNAVQASNSNLIQTNILKDNNALQTQTILQHLIPFFGSTATATVARSAV